jgi:hypothetical protein
MSLRSGLVSYPLNGYPVPGFKDTYYSYTFPGDESMVLTSRRRLESPFTLNQPMDNMLINYYNYSFPRSYDYSFPGSSYFSDKIRPYDYYPAITIGSNYYTYDNVNIDPDLRNRVVDYYQDKCEKWLKDTYADLLGYVSVRGSNVEFVKSEGDYSKGSQDIEKKSQFLREHIFRKKYIAEALERYANDSNVKWWDLRAKKSIVKPYLHDFLKAKIKHKIG